MLQKTTGIIANKELSVSAQVEERLLNKLIEAEKRGKPLTFHDLGMDARGSTFEDLWANMRIVVKGQEHSICSVASPDSEVIASDYGKWWIEKVAAERAGKPVPPPPPAQPVFMF